MSRLALAGFLLLLLAAPAAAQTAPGPITITARDNKWEPSEVSVPAGVKAELVIRNEQKKPAEFESHSLKREKVIPPGGSVSIFVGPLKPGRYEFIDDFNPAAKGVLVVQ
jgi:hypothetical protein